MSNHLATVGAIYEAFGKGDIPTILGYMADDVRWEEWDDNSAQRAGVPWLQPPPGQGRRAGLLPGHGRPR
jgi:ketosteroid isomerase-like protein